MDNRPIGVFDSGVGGLTVLNEIQEQLPGEAILYLGDTARVPYGSRSGEIVTQYTREAVRFLLAHDVKAIVIACNTASALALPTLIAQDLTDVPLFGVVEPGARAAAKATRTGVIGVIGTEGTVRSQAYQRAVRRHLPDAEIVGIGCPLFVPIIEEGWQDTQVAELTARSYLAGFEQHDMDALILGCTHYPPLWATLTRVLGDGVRLVNPAYETAKEVRLSLRETGSLSEGKEGGEVRFFVTDAPERFKRVGGHIVRRTIVQTDQVGLVTL